MTSPDAERSVSAAYESNMALTSATFWRLKYRRWCSTMSEDGGDDDEHDAINTIAEINIVGFQGLSTEMDTRL